MSSPAKRLATALRAITLDGKPEQVVDLARHWGIDGRLGRRAASGMDVNASAYLKLCAAVAIDPVTGERIPEGPRSIPDLDWSRVAIKVLMAVINNDSEPNSPIGRRSRRKSLRKLERAWNLPFATINRAKHGQPVSIESLLTIAAGLDVHPHAFLTVRPPLINQENNVPAVVLRETSTVNA